MALAEGSWWTTRHELAAASLEIIHEIYRVSLAKGGVKNAKLPTRIKVPRPGAKPAAPKPVKRRPATVDEVKSILAAAHRPR